MESEEPFSDEMPNFDICGTVFKELFKDIDVLDIDAKTETAASSENSGRKITENEQNKRKRSIVILEDDEIEEFQSKQVAKNTVKGTESAGEGEERERERERSASARWMTCLGFG